MVLLYPLVKNCIALAALMGVSHLPPPPTPTPTPIHTLLNNYDLHVITYFTYFNVKSN
jgi:hypothetical protein